jgi:hypothetical protein
VTERKLAAPTQADREAVANYLDRIAEGQHDIDCLVDGIYAVAEELRLVRRGNPRVEATVTIRGANPLTAEIFAWLLKR